MRAPHFRQSAVTSVPHRGHRVSLAAAETPVMPQSHSGFPQTSTSGVASRRGNTRLRGTPQWAQYCASSAPIAMPHFQQAVTIDAPQTMQITGRASDRGAAVELVHS